MVRLDFDPSTSVIGPSIRLETLAIAGAILFAMVFAALSAGWSRPVEDGSDAAAGAAAPKLRRDDLVLIAFGAVPGAVIGGRLDYVLVHLDYYSANPGAIADPGQGGFGLTLAVVLGTLTAITVALLLAAPVGRWLGVAAIPVLLGLGLGKLAMVLGGTGQGSYSNGPVATSYVGPGPWGSANPSFPAVPSQAIEGGLDLALAVLVLLLPFLLRLRVGPWRIAGQARLAPSRQWAFLTGGRRFLTVLGLWALVRFAAAFTWRDAHVVGPWVAEQLILFMVAEVALVGSVAAGLFWRAPVGPVASVASLSRRVAPNAYPAGDPATWPPGPGGD
ncbi:MAG: prolipoprotein diacylglyceryl transferase family protein [Candidatus Limnocylindrales bacterium]|jgi:prolipoprotein diacylglyceryltransferase